MPNSGRNNVISRIIEKCKMDQRTNAYPKFGCGNSNRICRHPENEKNLPLVVDYKLFAFLFYKNCVEPTLLSYIICLKTDRDLGGFGCQLCK